MYRKEWERNEEGCLDRVMTEFNDVPAVAAVPMNVDEETGEIIEHE
jgi:hypothetical protein